MSKFYRIYCSVCRMHLYNYHGEFVGKFNFKLFKPSNPGIAVPKPKTPMICPNCGQRWHMLRQNGSIMVVTDQGVKPRPPDGPKHLFTFPTEVAKYIDPIFRGEQTDFEEPSNAKDDMRQSAN